MPTWDPILITGASGFVGAHLCRSFLERGHQVVAVNGPSNRPWRLPEHPAFTRASVDLCSAAEVKRLVDETQPHTAIHCAAYGAYPSQTDPDRIYQVNLSAVRYLVEALRSVPKLHAFIQMGSSSEYGTNCGAPSENGATFPDSHYAVAKLAATSLIQYYAMKHGFRGWVMRLYSIYGPREESSRLIPTLLNKAMAGQLPPLVNPRISRDFVFVEDVTRAVLALFDRADQLKPGGVYNIGSGTKTTLEELVALSRRTFQITEEPQWGSMANRAWDHPDWYADPRKAERELGWKTTTALADGLRQTFEWMKQDAAGATAAAQHSVVKRTEGS